MIRFIFLLAFFFFLLGPLFNLLGQQADPSLIGRIADLKVRAQDHESQVANLLAKPSIPRTNFELPFSKVVEIENLPASQIPFIPVPEYVDGDSDLVREIPPSSTAADESVNVDKGINAVKSSEEAELEKAYSELYASKSYRRLEGYYFGPILGVVLPQDGAIRTRTNNSFIRTPYTPDTGFIMGAQVGKDFGGVRTEFEYSYLSFDASNGLSASLHNLLGRIILEKEIGERFDFRTGLGMGIGIVGVDSTHDISGTGFTYDFLLGAGYRLAENFSVQLDYRYYLTAAHDHYDHIKSHVWLVSAGFDI